MRCVQLLQKIPANASDKSVQMLKEAIFGSWSGDMQPEQQLAILKAIALQLPNPQHATQAILRAPSTLTLQQLQTQKRDLDRQHEFVAKRSIALGKGDMTTAGDILAEEIQQKFAEIVRTANVNEKLQLHSALAFRSKPANLDVHHSSSPSNAGSYSRNAPAASNVRLSDKRIHPAATTIERPRNVKRQKISDMSSPSHSATRSLGCQATTVLKNWMFSPQHIQNPYPSDSEKSQLATMAGITKSQVSNWFVNGRKRLWQPLHKNVHVSKPTTKALMPVKPPTSMQMSAEESEERAAVAAACTLLALR